MSAHAHHCQQMLQHINFALHGIQAYQTCLHLSDKQGMLTYFSALSPPTSLCCSGAQFKHNVDSKRALGRFAGHPADASKSPETRWHAVKAMALLR